MAGNGTTGRGAAGGSTGPRATRDAAFCAVLPSPELRERMRDAAQHARESLGLPPQGLTSLLREPRRLGFNDGVILPPRAFPAGVSSRTVRHAAAERAPLRGKVRVVVVLVDFPDRAFGVDPSRFTELFFSEGAVPTGSVKEYFADVTGGLVEIDGEVVGPLTMPRPLAWYANGNFGIGQPSGDPRAQYMARDAAVAADPLVDLALYDNDGNGYVDAFVVVHAGSGGEQTGDSGDIWSHKWVLEAEHVSEGANVFAYLTIPEDAKLGVSAHELGHLLFGFPDLYDTDYTSAGVGAWCLMGGGSWNGGGDTPAHPSAWCKVQQGWVTVENVTADTTLELPDVKASRTVHRLWSRGEDGPECFLLENRQQAGYDELLPSSGLLVWHVDDGQESNADEEHPLVALVQADGQRHLEQDWNTGDGGDPYPGWNVNRELSATTTPASTSYAGQDTGVVVSAISDSGTTMTARVSVTGTVPDVEPPDDEQPGGDPDVAELAAAVEALRTRVAQLETAVSSAGSALGQVWPQGAPEPPPAAARPGPAVPRQQQGPAWSRPSRT